MIKYTVRSRDLVGIYSDVKSKRLIPDAYFQRNLVWRELHKQDFIKTILLGFPFPQIFISKGAVDIENMVTTSCIVDGQQRTNAIVEFIENSFMVDGRYFKELSNEEKERFLKYDVAVIELDLDNNHPAVKDIFQRINRTANALTAIEKMASEYAPAEFMFVGRLIVDDIALEDSDEYQIDPNIPDTLIEWGRNQDLKKVQKLFLSGGIFTEREVIRKVPLQYILNIMATLVGDYFHRNEGARECLENYEQEFPAKEQVINLIAKTSALILQIKLPSKSIWMKKATFFSLFIELAKSVRNDENISINSLKEKLLEFEGNTPEDFELAAREGVNNRQERIIRARHTRALIEHSL